MGEGETVITEQAEFVDTRPPDSGVPDNVDYCYYEVEIPSSYVVGLEDQTPIAADLRTPAGHQMQGTLRIEAADEQARPHTVLLEEPIQRVEIEERRPEVLPRTRQPLIFQPGHRIQFWVRSPDEFSAEESRIKIGTIQNPVRMKQQADLTPKEQSALNGVEIPDTRRTAQKRMVGTDRAENGDTADTGDSNDDDESLPDLREVYDHDESDSAVQTDELEAWWQEQRAT